MKKVAFLTLVALTITLASLCWGQAKEPSTDLQLKLMKDQNRIRSIKAKNQGTIDQYQQLLQKFNASPEVLALQKQNTDNQAKQAAAEKDFEQDKDEAYKQVGLKKEDYDLDEDTLVFSPKPKPAPATPSAEKK
jgi:hypothetical protein